MPIFINDIPVYGTSINQYTRCVHYHSEFDVIAILFKCCQRFYACFECHQEAANHQAEKWQQNEFNELAILCGGCGNQLSIKNYLTCENQCPHCKIRFNPGCKNHYSLYFAAND